MSNCFHLAYNVRDLNLCRDFYIKVLGCIEGRSTETWIDLNFFGHQLSLHLGEPFSVSNTGLVDKYKVPMPHLGLILPMTEWEKLAQNLVAHHIQFIIPPSIRFKGKPGEQAIMFFSDPSGNPIEIKGFSNMTSIFAK